MNVDKRDNIKYRLAIHEAGHWVIANHLKYKCGDIILKLSQNKDGSTRTQGISISSYDNIKLDSIDKIKQHIKNRIYILNAGAISEAFLNDDFDESAFSEAIHTGGGAIDHCKIIELFNILERIEFDNDREKLWNEIDSTSYNLIKDNHHSIKRVASYISSQVNEFNKEYKFQYKELKELI